MHTPIATVTSGANPVENASVIFTVTGSNPNTGEARTARPTGQARFAYTGTKPGADTIAACFDANFNDTCDPTEAKASATKTWLPTTLSLAPATASDMTGRTHTLTATLNVSPSGPPVPTVLILFTVTGANKATGQATTGTAGTATFTYTGRNPGTDTITACQDTNNNRHCDPGEPTATAKMTWVGLPITGTPLTPIITTGGALILLGALTLLTPLLTRRTPHIRAPQ
jgi:hypothetical protein